MDGARGMTLATTHTWGPTHLHAHTHKIVIKKKLLQFIVLSVTQPSVTAEEGESRVQSQLGLHSKTLFKKQKSFAREVVQQLRACTALAEVLSSDPSTHVR